jgi:hypothetical protein
MGGHHEPVGWKYEECVSYLSALSREMWGRLMRSKRVEGVAEMAAIGFELDPDPASELGFSGKRFVDAGRYGYVV